MLEMKSCSCLNGIFIFAEYNKIDVIDLIVKFTYAILLNGVNTHDHGFMRMVLINSVFAKDDMIGGKQTIRRKQTCQ